MTIGPPTSAVRTRHSMVRRNEAVYDLSRTVERR